MSKNQQEIKLAKQLLSKLDVLVDKWLDYFNQRNITRLESDDITQNALDHFYGIGTNYIDIKCLKEALVLLHLFFKDPQNPTLTTKSELVDKEFNCLFDIFGDCLEFTPKAINDIAYLVYHCYEHREILFVKLNQEKLNFYTHSAEKASESLALWEQEKDNLPPL